MHVWEIKSVCVCEQERHTEKERDGVRERDREIKGVR